MSNSIFFRFEINKKNGSGHAIRCLRIADYLYKKKFKIFLIVTEKSYNNLNENNLVDLNKFKILKIKNNNSSKKDAQYTLNSILNQKTNDKIFIFKDDYKLDLIWDNFIIKNYSNLIILDDHINKKHNCKTYINFNPYQLNQIKYKKKQTKYLIGLKYFPYSKKIINNKKKNNCLVYFGASDNEHLTIKIIKIINKLNLKNIHFIILIGKFNNDKVVIKKNTQSNYFSLVDKHIDLSKIFNRSKFMIGTGGTSLWEALVHKIYPFIIPTHKNHIDPCLYLFKKNKINYLKNFEINEESKKKYIFDYFKILPKLPKYNIIDNNGLKRIYNNLDV